MSATDTELVQKLLNATTAGKVDWEPTGVTDQFKCTFSGKWMVTIDKGTDGDTAKNYFWLTMLNAKGSQLMQLFSTDVPYLPELFELARRRSLKIDDAIADLLKE